MFVTLRANPSEYFLFYGISTLVVVSMLLLIGCDDVSGINADVEPRPDVESERTIGSAISPSHLADAEARRGVAAFRRATARYQRVDAAVEDGFEQILPCLSNPDGEGAIGIPYANFDRFDAAISLEDPEILFYEPQRNGTLRLVGGEPVIPISLWTEEMPPSLFGREFHRNEAHGLFGLHTWAWRHSPDGVFSFWNTNVSCEFAE